MTRVQGEAPSLLVISGPSGAGKGTLIARLLEENRRCHQIPALTTRPPRRGEHCGGQFDFIDASEMDRLDRAGNLMACSKTFGVDRYAIAKWAFDSIPTECLALIEVDYPTMVAVRQCRSCTTVLIAPPSRDVARRRLEARGGHSSREIEVRLDCGRDILSASDEYDYLIINDDLWEAFRQLNAIVTVMGVAEGRRASNAVLRKQIQ